MSPGARARKSWGRCCPRASFRCSSQGPYPRVCNRTGACVFRSVREPGRSSSRPAASRRSSGCGGVAPREGGRGPDSGGGEEVWSFEPVDRLRASAIEGPSSIDPSQANVPSDWAHLPAYRLSPGDEITVAERSRGPGDEDRNQIAVERNLWWDFAGTGYTFQDLVSGRMQQDWRLAMAEPYRLQGARQNGQPLLVTQGEDDRAGIEVRTPDLGIEATGRIEQRGALPASGWTTRLASLGITLRPPPGHRLLRAPRGAPARLG